MNNPAASDRPNIVFINTDQQSSQMMSCAGNRYLKTPAMDRLAEEGICFKRAYTTNPVCVPARFSFFTGRMPSELNIRTNKHGMALEKIPENILQNTAGQLLKNAGYRVAYGGKTHLPGDMSPETMGCENISADKRDELAQVSADWIRDQGAKGDQPFFLSICMVNPHDICFMGMRDFIRETRGDAPDLNFNERWLLGDDSVEMSELNRALSLPEGMSEEAFFANHCPPLPPNHQPQEDEPEAVRMQMGTEGFRHYIRENWGEKTWRLHRWAYGRLTERVDEQVGVVLKAIDDAGLTENTLVIFTSDHGDHSGSHKLDQKVIPYEEAARIPLLMRWPARIAAGQVETKIPVSNGLDLVPTFCDVAECVVPADLKGQSLMPLATGNQTSPSREAIPMEWENGRGIVYGDMKYLLYDEGGSREQLMDLAGDPYETKNHVNDPDLQEELAKSRKVFDRMFA